MSKRRTEIEKRALELLIKRVRFETARIGFEQEQLDAIRERARFMADDTAEIRAATELYVESWIVPILEALRDGDTRTLKVLAR